MIGPADPRDGHPGRTSVPRKGDKPRAEDQHRCTAPQAEQ